jgi:hypothetical protein
MAPISIFALGQRSAVSIQRSSSPGIKS